MKLVYICSPYAGNIEENIRFAQTACRYAIGQGCAPIAVHLLYPLILNDGITVERQIGIQMGLRVLASCEELWIYGSRISLGMEKEIDYAKDAGIPVRHVLEMDMQMKENPLSESDTLLVPEIH